MKKRVLGILLLLGAAISLFAQYSERIPVYVSGITGTGSTPEDNDIFVSLLNRELRARGFVLSELLADYYFTGELSPADDGKFYFTLAMYNYDDELLEEQGLFYTTMEEANSYLPYMLYQLLSGVFALRAYIPDQEIVELVYEKIEEPVDPEAWRSHPWYFGAGAFWNPRLYYGRTLETHLVNFGFGFSAEYHLVEFESEKLEFMKYLAVGTDVEFTYDWVVASPRIGDKHWNTILQIPLTIKGVFRPGGRPGRRLPGKQAPDEQLGEQSPDVPLLPDERLSGEESPGKRFMLQPYAGIIFNIPLIPNTTIPPPLSWVAGFQFNMRAGEGVFYADTRYAMDFGKSDVTEKRLSNPPLYNRYMIYMGIGYKRDYNLTAAVQGVIHTITERIETKRAAKQQEQEINEDAEWEYVYLDEDEEWNWEEFDEFLLNDEIEELEEDEFDE